MVTQRNGTIPIRCSVSSMLLWLLVMIVSVTTVLRFSFSQQQGKLFKKATLLFHNHRDNNNNNNTQAKASKQEYWLPLERFKVSPHQWRAWLERLDYSKDAIKLSNLKLANIRHAGRLCGMSAMVQFSPSDGALSFSSSTRHHHGAFWKVQYSNMSEFDAESHLREIKACHLDRVLGTQVTMPCVGHRMVLTAQFKQNNMGIWNPIQDSLNCAIYNNTRSSSSSGTRNQMVVEGSMMMFLEDVVTVSKERIISEARVGEPSALNNIAFHYLGGCIKSFHNIFYYEDGGKFVALDNDRCFTPNSVAHAPTVAQDPNQLERVNFWKESIYELACQLPRRVQSRLLETMATKRGTPDDNNNNTPSISTRVIEGLKEDVLAEALINSQPEAFKEIDDRAHQLAVHIQKNCRNHDTEVYNKSSALAQRTTARTTIKKYWPAQETFGLPSSHWRLWLQEYYNETATLKYVKSWGGTGCGFSAMVLFPDVTYRGYFKTQAGAKNRGTASLLLHESEIKASYLDRILGTEVTPPSVGHRLMMPVRFDRIDQRMARKDIVDHLKCVDGLLSSIDGSMSLWLDNLHRVPHEKVIRREMVSKAH